MIHVRTRDDLQSFTNYREATGWYIDEIGRLSVLKDGESVAVYNADFWTAVSRVDVAPAVRAA